MSRAERRVERLRTGEGGANAAVLAIVVIEPRSALHAVSR
jgi:hypothetical protein